MNFLKKNGAGLLLCLAISIPAWFLGKSFPVIGGPVFAILIGMVLTLILKEKVPFTAGINYTSKKILQAAVIYLGFGMNLSQILAGGKQSVKRKTDIIEQGRNLLPTDERRLPLRCLGDAANII